MATKEINTPIVETKTKNGSVTAIDQKAINEKTPDQKNDEKASNAKASAGNKDRKSVV